MGGRNASHCAFAPPFLDYIRQAFEEIATLMDASGLAAMLPFGAVLWWWNANASGMAFCDAATASRFQTLYGRLPHLFVTPYDVRR